MSDESRKKYLGIAGLLGLVGVGLVIYAWQKNMLEEDSIKPDLTIDLDALIEMIKKWLQEHMNTGNPGGGNPSEPSIRQSNTSMSQQSLATSSSGQENRAFMQVFANISVESWMLVSAAVAISALVGVAAYVYHQQQNTSRTLSSSSGMKS